MILIVLPVLTLYAGLSHFSQNLPETDDYDAVLVFLEKFLGQHGAQHRILYFLATQHVQYKLWLVHLVVLLQYGVLGHVNFAFLQQLGNILVLLTAGLLCLYLRPAAKTFTERALFSAPVIFLLFAPRYGETLNWAAPGIQNLGVVFFSLLAVYLAARTSTAAFWTSLLAILLAVAASVNGFAAAAFCVLLHLQQGRRVRAGVTVGCASVLLALYAFHYTAAAVPVIAGDRHFFWTPILFFFAVLGTAGSRHGGVLFGLLLVLWAAYMVRQRWMLLDPRSCCAAGFVIATGLGLAFARRNQALERAFAPRYDIYSQVLLALLYIAALNLFMGPYRWQPALRKFFWTFFLCSLLFCVWGQISGYRLMRTRMALLQEHFTGWQQTHGAISLIPDEVPDMRTPEMLEFRKRAVEALRTADMEGIYHPPHTLQAK